MSQALVIECKQECWSCSGVESSSECNHRIQCDDGEVCYMHNFVTESGAVEFDYGCGSSLANGYRLLVSKYDGTAGDSLSRQNGHQFTTFDRDNDGDKSNCAVLYKGAWWYDNCHKSNLNGVYYHGHHDEYATGIDWYTFHGYHYSMKTTMMMIRKY
ncbi:unnamed protein product [Mytilus edulis]|uniref:Fibrinogen C-terminal domain-containing protein n=1 Tax=Mytilus edulis TaxID=6550 RepID=A0A8S3QM34_MYTED|nr:unnamed protein product [Mytilus edulis]